MQLEKVAAKYEKTPRLRTAATIINGMRPKTIGRTLGIGLRVAGRVAGERLAGSTQTARHAQAHQQVVGSGMASGGAGQAATHSSGSLARGIGGFLRPFGRVGRALWLEIVGVFFFLPVLIFGSAMWRTRASWNHGPQHGEFLISAIVAVVFLYLGITSFWRAWRK